MIVKCPECGHEVSTLAVTCQHCGARKKESEAGACQKVWGIVKAVVVVYVALDYLKTVRDNLPLSRHKGSGLSIELVARQPA